MRWLPYVMVRITISFITGILVALYFPDFVPEHFLRLLFFFFIGAYFVAFAFVKKFRLSGTVTGIVGLLAVLLAGYLVLLNKTEQRSPQHLTHITVTVEFYVGSINGVPQVRPGSVKAEMLLTKIKADGRWQHVNGRILLYFALDSQRTNVEAGNEIMIKGAPASIASPGNPEEFDFKKYLSLKNISHQHFLQPEAWKVIAHTEPSGLSAFAWRARRWATACIKRNISGIREQAITMALVLGVSEGLDNELQAAYSASGAMHVLSVSGLHVGIIYAIILLLLKPISTLAWSRWLIAALSLVALWAYALVTGLSPSVLRAVMMFSFIVLARPFGRNTNIYNTLAASGFLLLLHDPFLILSVGFQLSYLAVVGIIALQKKIYRLWEASSPIADKLWQMTSVSIAAQLATFALGLFYFHQFPVYFLISNMIVIPLSTAVLIAGIALLVVSPVTWAASGAAWIVKFLIGLLNGSVFLIEDLPGSVVDNVQISLLQCILLMVLTVLFLFLLEERKFRWLVCAAGISGWFGVLQWQHFFNDVAINQWVVYNVRGYSAMERLDNGRAILFASPGLVHDKQKIRYHLQPYRIFSGIQFLDTTAQRSQLARSYQGYRIFLWKKFRVLCILEASADIPDHIDADILIISNNSVSDLENIKRKVAVKKVIFDSSNSDRYVTRTIRLLEASGVSVTAISRDGAFILK